MIELTVEVKAAQWLNTPESADEILDVVGIIGEMERESRRVLYLGYKRAIVPVYDRATRECIYKGANIGDYVVWIKGYPGVIIMDRPIYQIFNMEANTRSDK